MLVEGGGYISQGSLGRLSQVAYSRERGTGRRIWRRKEKGRATGENEGTVLFSNTLVSNYLLFALNPAVWQTGAGPGEPNLQMSCAWKEAVLRA